MTWQRLVLPPTAESVAAARAFVVEVIGGLDWIRPRIEDLRLVVSEVVTNAVKAYDDGDATGPIEMAVQVQPDAVEVEITDHAGGFELPSEPPPLPHEGQENGRGLALVASMADGVSYRAVPEGTCVHLQWRRPG